MITEDYVSFEVAKLLKEKGFDEKNVDLWYDESGEMFCELYYNIKYNWRIKNHEEVFQCPTLQMAMKWLRENHNKHCDTGYDIDLKWFFQIVDLKEIVEFDYPEAKYYHSENETGFKTYEEAVEAALKYALENLI